MIDCEELDRRSTDRRTAGKQGLLPLEVLIPVIQSRMEQSNHPPESGSMLAMFEPLCELPR